MGRVGYEGKIYPIVGSLLVVVPFFFLFNIFVQLFRERLIVGKSACDNPERYGVVSSSQCSSKKFERMAQEAIDVCLRMLKGK